MTTTTEASEALARLREVVKPGDTLRIVSRGYTRSGVQKCQILAADGRNITVDTSTALGIRLLPPACIACSGTDRPIVSPLSVALFGEPGQIKGEYL